MGAKETFVPLFYSITEERNHAISVRKFVLMFHGILRLLDTFITVVQDLKLFHINNLYFVYHCHPLVIFIVQIFQYCWLHVLSWWSMGFRFKDHLSGVRVFVKPRLPQGQFQFHPWIFRHLQMNQEFDWKCCQYDNDSNYCGQWSITVEGELDESFPMW